MFCYEWNYHIKSQTLLCSARPRTLSPLWHAGAMMTVLWWVRVMRSITQRNQPSHCDVHGLVICTFIKMLCCIHPSDERCTWSETVWGQSGLMWHNMQLILKSLLDRNTGLHVRWTAVKHQSQQPASCLLFVVDNLKHTICLPRHFSLCNPQAVSCLSCHSYLPVVVWLMRYLKMRTKLIFNNILFRVYFAVHINFCSCCRALKLTL